MRLSTRVVVVSTVGTLAFYHVLVRFELCDEEMHPLVVMYQRYVPLKVPTSPGFPECWLAKLNQV